MTSKGSCHCGNVAFEVDGTPDKAMSCNCSICQRTDPKGNRMAAINIRCLEGIDLDAVPVAKFDGRSR